MPAGLFAEVSNSFSYPFPDLPIGIVICRPFDQTLQLHLKYFSHLRQFAMTQLPDLPATLG